FRNDGTGRFNDRILGSGPASGYLFALKLADLDTDGDLDAIYGAALPGTVTVGRATSVAEFTFEEDGYYPFGQLVRHCDAIDYDGDCDLDLVVIDGPGRTVLTRRNNTPQQGCGGVASSDADNALNAARDDDAASVDGGKSEPGMLPAEARRDWNEDGVVDGTDVAIWLATRSEARGSNAEQSASKASTSPVKGESPMLDARTPAKVERKGGSR
ncbi:MAG: FG-GAP repeat domain-containing protein, partial [bacterium]